MSWRNPTPLEELQIEEPCSMCGARAGEWCETHTGTPAQMPHAPRYRLALAKRRQARRNGQSLL